MASLKGFKIYYSLIFNFRTTNNEAKYEALLARLQLAKELEAKKIKIELDSKFVVGQVHGMMKAQYMNIAWEFLAEFNSRQLRLQKYPGTKTSKLTYCLNGANGYPHHITKITRVVEVGVPSI